MIDSSWGCYVGPYAVNRGLFDPSNPKLPFPPDPTRIGRRPGILPPGRRALSPGHPDSSVQIDRYGSAALELLGGRDRLERIKLPAVEPSEENIVVAIPVAIPNHGGRSLPVDRNPGFPIVRRVITDLNLVRPARAVMELQENVRIAVAVPLPSHPSDLSLRPARARTSRGCRPSAATRRPRRARRREPRSAGARHRLSIPGHD